MSSTFVITPEMRRSVEEHLLQRGKWKRISGRQQIEFTCLAPGHEDRNPSAHYNPASGVWICRSCGVGGGTIDLCRRLNIDTQNLTVRRPRPKVAAGQQPVTVYTYRHIPSGNMYTKGRFEFPEHLNEKGKPEKSFQWSPRFTEDVSVADMGLFWGLDPASKPNDPVVFVEGEEVAKALAARGVLACSGGWGASQRTFGEGLKELQGRVVWLAADNDKPGHDYMDAIAAELRERHIPAKLKWIRLPLGEGEDLYDFFRKGGQVEDIWKGDLSEPIVEFKGPDHLNIVLPHGAHIIAFDLSGMRRTRDKLDAKLACTVVTQPGASTYYQRINLMSASSRAGLRTELGRMFETDKGLNWAIVINELCALAENAYLSQDNGIDLYSVEEVEASETWLIEGLVPLNQPTIFFGDGESLKTMLALRVGVSVGYGYPFLGSQKFPGAEGRVLYVDYENMTAPGLRRRIARIVDGIDFGPLAPDVFRYWNGRGVAFTEQADLIAEEVRRYNVQLVIIDSAMPALGGADANDAAAVSAFYDALSTLNCTPLIIAHVSKESEFQRIAAHDRKPFGSAAWHNLSRRTYFFQRGDSVMNPDHVQLAVINAKANEGPRARPLAVQVDFWGRDGRIAMENKDWQEMDISLDRLRPYALRMADVLAGGEMQLSQLATKLGSKSETLALHLKKYPDRFVHWQGEDGKGYWGLRAIG